MLRFYHRVRKQLIEEGRLKKYVVYAVGEIFLIVFGILIALQLNEWNAQRKERQSEHAYYCKLLEDVIQDSITLDQLLEENAERIHSANEMLALLQQDKPDQRAVVKAMRGAISKVTFTFKPAIAAFEDLKSSGNLKISQGSKHQKQRDQLLFNNGRLCGRRRCEF